MNQVDSLTLKHTIPTFSDLFPKCFLHFSTQISFHTRIYFVVCKCFQFGQSKILSFDNELNHLLPGHGLFIFKWNETDESIFRSYRMFKTKIINSWDKMHVYSSDMVVILCFSGEAECDGFLPMFIRRVPAAIDAYTFMKTLFTSAATVNRTFMALIYKTEN